MADTKRARELAVAIVNSRYTLLPEASDQLISLADELEEASQMARDRAAFICLLREHMEGAIGYCRPVDTIIRHALSLQLEDGFGGKQ